MDTQNVVLFAVLSACGVALVAWFCLIIYRGTLETREGDQIFLDKAEEGLAREQREIVARIERINPVIRNVMIVWIVLALTSAGLWIWQGLKSF
ncbi:MAG TPA: hypothetical protein VGR81_04685 [Candidatus Acidoferrales bacterium]|nr:hypothetical protein [Candidatus Acidoferrales bacterium]